MCFLANPIWISENEYFRRNKHFAGNTRFWKQGMKQLIIHLIDVSLWWNVSFTWFICVIVMKCIINLISLCRQQGVITWLFLSLRRKVSSTWLICGIGKKIFVSTYFSDSWSRVRFGHRITVFARNIFGNCSILDAGKRTKNVWKLSIFKLYRLSTSLTHYLSVWLSLVGAPHSKVWSIPSPYLGDMEQQKSWR